ncbi:MAG: putative transport system ATP-binding protein [Thermoplasmata archaeon]|jgi:lipoprotein-releasing system ATP-binding protein|nr:putative transport system ATP-binding protein [Thermoplasmata archaeon]
MRVEPPVLALRGVRRAYRAAGHVVTPLEGVALDVAAGERVVVRGRSGSGKTTLLAVAGLLDAPDAGTVLHKGRDLWRATDAERARERLTGIGFVFQHFHLLPRLSAQENVALPMKAAGATDAGARAAELLSRMGLAERAGHLPHQLSGGQQQVVAVARALANRPYLVLADEPTGELDPESARRVMDALDEACAQSEAALMLVTHDPGLAPPGARQVRIEGGRLA